MMRVRARQRGRTTENNTATHACVFDKGERTLFFYIQRGRKYRYARDAASINRKNAGIFQKGYAAGSTFGVCVRFFVSCAKIMIMYLYMQYDYERMQ